MSVLTMIRTGYCLRFVLLRTGLSVECGKYNFQFELRTALI